MNIPFSYLTRMFPKDTVWANGCAEIVGYSPKKNMHIVIDDGQCWSDDGTYVVHVYHPSNKNHKTEWMPNENHEWALKHVDGEKIFEECVNFSDWEEVKKYIDMWSDY